jgi:hypothetical protein
MFFLSIGIAAAQTNPSLTWQRKIGFMRMRTRENLQVIL